MPRPSKISSSRSTPRLSTRSQQQSPPGSKVWVSVLKHQQGLAAGTRGEISDYDNDSVCSSSKSSDVVIPRPPVTKGKSKDETGTGKVSAPWRHPDELDYLRPYDWSEDRIISQLRATVFSVPQPVNGKQSFIEITLFDDGDFDKPTRIKIPRGYRVPLMFVAKFQWASLKLVLTSAQREKEWADYKFDILHLSRLCARFFSEAREACNVGVVEIPPMRNAQVQDGAMSRKWRCPTFDRALARYNKNWLISREEFLRDFYIEFEDEEYVKDVLKIDWSRWALKGHKGFKLTQDELKCGIDARMLTRGLKKDDNGKWVWVDDYMIKQEEVAALVDPLLPPDNDLALSSVSGDEVKTTPLPHEPDESTLHANGRNASQPNLLSVATLTTVQPSSPSSQPNPSTRASSDAISERTARQPSPFVEKFHSPLSSLPSSASPSEAPVQSFDQQQASGRNSITTPPKPSPTNLESPSADITAVLHFESLPPLIIPSSPGSPVRATPASDGTQPPKSKSPVISTPERTRSAEAISFTSPLTPMNPETFVEDQSQGSTAGREMETEDVPSNRELSPTSIDSTPNPSPAIQPQTVAEYTKPAGTPALLAIDTTGSSPDSQSFQSRGSLSDPPPSPDPNLSVKSHPKDIKYDRATDSPTKFPLISHRPSVPDVQEKSSELSIRSDASVEIETPTLSPLLPPERHTHSPSPDEIPGLGELSSRRPLGLPLQSDAPKTTMFTYTLTNWSGSDDSSTELKKEPDEPDISMDIDNTELGEENATCLEVHAVNSQSNLCRSQAKLDMVSSMDVVQQARPADDDDDSDMDFGTPETSPVIIVPEPETEVLQPLPPLFCHPDPPVASPKEEPPNFVTPHSRREFATQKPVTVRAKSTARTSMSSTQNRILDNDQIGRNEELSSPRSSDISAQNGSDCSSLTHDGLENIRPNGTPSRSESIVTDVPVPPQPPHLNLTTAPEYAVGVSTQIPPASGFSSMHNVQKISTVSAVDGHGGVSPYISPRPVDKTHPVSRTQSFDVPSGSPTHYQVRDSEKESPMPLVSPRRERRPQVMPLDVDTIQLPSHSTPRKDLPNHNNSSQAGSFIIDQGNMSSLEHSCSSQVASTSRKRQRQDETEDEADEEMALKSRKRGEGLSIRESGVVIRKVVSMVRDTLTGLNDLLEIAAEQDLIPTSRSRAKSKGKERARDASFMEESQLHSPTTPSTLPRTPALSHIYPETTEVARLSRELQTLRAEMTFLREKSASDALSPDPGEPDHIRAMRTELDMLREQVRVLKGVKPPSAETLEVKTMRNELSTLRSDIRSLQDISRRSSLPSTPSSPNQMFRFSPQTGRTVHPLAHLLAVESDAATFPAPTIGHQPPRPHPDGMGGQPGLSPRRPSVHVETSETPKTTSPVSRPTVFDDIPLPVKSKRKARMIFSKG